MRHEKIKIWEPLNQEESEAVEYEISYLNRENRTFHASDQCKLWCERYGSDYLTDGVRYWNLSVRYDDGDEDTFAVKVEAVPEYHVVMAVRLSGAKPGVEE